MRIDENHPLAVAARDIDSYSENHTFDETLEHFTSFNKDELLYVAEQRALRLLFIMKGRSLQSLPGLTVHDLTPLDKPIFTMLTTQELDGIMIGITARDGQFL